MDDQKIIELYNERDELAVKETREFYGAYIRSVAMNLLGNEEDAKECESDTLLAAWNSIPPAQPSSLKYYLGKIVRNLAISRYRRDHAARRFCSAEQLLSELDECIASDNNTEKAVEQQELVSAVNGWLKCISTEDAAIFIRRYYHSESVAALAAETGWRPEKVSQRLFKLRRKLRDYLISEELI